jgi:hypothetical protein
MGWIMQENFVIIDFWIFSVVCFESIIVNAKFIIQTKNTGRIYIYIFINNIFIYFIFILILFTSKWKKM